MPCFVSPFIAIPSQRTSLPVYLFCYAGSSNSIMVLNAILKLRGVHLRKMAQQLMQTVWGGDVGMQILLLLVGMSSSQGAYVSVAIIMLKEETHLLHLIHVIYLIF